MRLRPLLAASSLLVLVGAATACGQGAAGTGQRESLTEAPATTVATPSGTGLADAPGTAGTPATLPPAFPASTTRNPLYALPNLAGQ